MGTVAFMALALELTGSPTAVILRSSTHPSTRAVMTERVRSFSMTMAVARTVRPKLARSTGAIRTPMFWTTSGAMVTMLRLSSDDAAAPPPDAAILTSSMPQIGQFPG